MLQRTQKVVVFGGGSFGTAVGSAIARQKADLAVSLLLRDPYICKAINETHRNTRYLAVSCYACAPLISMIACVHRYNYHLDPCPFRFWNSVPAWTRTLHRRWSDLEAGPRPCRRITRCR